MTITSILAIAIGLALTYTILSLIASSIKEGIANFLNLRGSQLQATLKAILTDDLIPAATAALQPPADSGNAAQANAGNAALDANANPVPAPTPAPVANPNPASASNLTTTAKPAFDAVYGHPLISSLGLKKMPSLVPTRNFTLALLAAIGKGRVAATVDDIKTDVAALPPNGRLRATLTALLSEAETDVDSAKAAIDAWFDNAMAILSAKYKALAQTILFVIGLVLAVALNVDTVQVVTALANSADLQGKITTMAQSIQLPAPTGTAPASTTPAADAAAVVNTPTQATTALIGQLQQLPIPMGWPTCPAGKDTCPGAFQGLMGELEKTPLAFLTRILGWLLTAAAISLGAPFWFDLLNQMVGRNTVPPPTTDGQ